MRRASRPDHLNRLLRVLDCKLEVVQPSTLHAPKEVELVADIRQWLGVHAHLLVGYRKTRHILRTLLKELGNQSLKEMVRDKANDDADRNREEAKNDGHGPELATLLLLSNLESFAANENDQDLTTTHDSADTNKEPVLGKAFENVELVIQTTVTVYVRKNPICITRGGTYFHWLKICIQTNVLKTSVLISSALGFGSIGTIGPW